MLGISKSIRPEGRTSWINCEFGNYTDNAVSAIHHVDGIEQIFMNCRLQGFIETGYFKEQGDLVL